MGRVFREAYEKRLLTDMPITDFARILFIWPMAAAGIVLGALFIRRRNRYSTNHSTNGYGSHLKSAVFRGVTLIKVCPNISILDHHPTAAFLWPPD